MAVHGHQALLGSLHAHLPAVSVFEGPFSVGRWTMAEHLRWYHNVGQDDVLRVRELDVESVRTIREFSRTAPADGPFKLVILELSKASRAAQTALAYTLEDPGLARFIIVGQSSELLAGTRSRSVVYRFRFLSQNDIATILIEKMNFSPERAREVASRSSGQVYPAIKLADSEETILLVRTALRALRTKDTELLSELATKWTDEATGFLAQWCNETISGQWRVFDHEDHVAGRALPVSILAAIRPRVRPRLVVRAQLMSVLRGNDDR